MSSHIKLVEKNVKSARPLVPLALTTMSSNKTMISANRRAAEMGEGIEGDDDVAGQTPDWHSDHLGEDTKENGVEKDGYDVIRVQPDGVKPNEVTPTHSDKTERYHIRYDRLTSDETVGSETERFFKQYEQIMPLSGKEFEGCENEIRHCEKTADWTNKLENDVTQQKMESIRNGDVTTEKMGIIDLPNIIKEFEYLGKKTRHLRLH